MSLSPHDPVYNILFDSESKVPGACVIADETLVSPVNVLIKELNAVASATVSPFGPSNIVKLLIVIISLLPGCVTDVIDCVVAIASLSCKNEALPPSVVVIAPAIDSSV